jgi:hypothetical protein
MVLSLIILVPFSLISIWLYFKSSPKHIEKQTGHIYNFIIVVLSLLACLAVGLYTYYSTGQSADRAWWPILAFLGSLFVLPIVLILGGLIRNFILFRK